MSQSPAQVAKDKGNAAFKSGDYAAAIGHYSAAIVADSINPTYPLNRAAAYLKLGKYEDAERDSSRVISLDQKNVKAWFRRAQARAALERYDEALTDLKHASKLEPSNQDVKKELVKTEELRNAKKAEAQKRNARRQGVSRAVAPNPPPHPDRRRVPITIVEAEASTSRVPPAMTAPAPVVEDIMKPISSRLLTTPKSPSPMAISPTIESTVKEPISPAPALKSPEPEPMAISPPPSSPSPGPSPIPPVAPVSRVGGGIFRPDGQHTIFGTAKPETRGNGSAAPNTLFTFMRIWETFKEPDNRWAFIQQITPTSFPNIFKSSLEPSTLVSILQTFQAVLQHSSNPEDAATIKEYMVNLPRVPRWTTIILFLGADERKLITDIWDRLPPGADDVRARQAWGLRSI